MVKMRQLKNPGDAFYTEDPSWFWSTFEFNDNPGVQHVRKTLISQRAPLSNKRIASMLKTAGITDSRFQAFAPNGTQIRLTENGTGTTPVILGHTDMEDFAGSPNTAQPAYWTRFEASCHSGLQPRHRDVLSVLGPNGRTRPRLQRKRYLGRGFRRLDFMWPIAFQAK